MRLLLALALALPAGLLSQGVRPALAAAGDLDPTFDGDGIVLTTFGVNDVGRAITIQADGKVVVAGRTAPRADLAGDFALARYLPSGALDPTFGSGGRVTTDFGGDEGAYALVIQPDGKLVAAGIGRIGVGLPTPAFALVRYLPNGSLDASFGVGGRVLTTLGGDAYALALQADGKLIAAGRISGPIGGPWTLSRYHQNGSLDESFGDGGTVVLQHSWSFFPVTGTTAYAVAVQADGKIVLMGRGPPEGIGLVRFNPDGSLDAGFGSGGVAVAVVGPPSSAGPSIGRALLIQPDGKIVVAGGFVAGDCLGFCLVRFNRNGTLDAGFVFTDSHTAGEAHALALQADGKLVASGARLHEPDGTVVADIALARYNPDGRLDAGFGNGGKVTTDLGLVDVAFAVATQADGKVVIAGVRGESPLHGIPPEGPADFVLARYLGGGAGGTGLGISPEAARVRLGWTGGGDQLGYFVARDPEASAVLPAGATAYTDVAPAPPPTLNCFVLVPFGPAGPLGVSDALCARQGLASPVGAPQAFTLRLNQSSTASLSWADPPGTVGSVLVALPLDGRPPRYQPLAASTTSATDATGGAFHLLPARRGDAGRPVQHRPGLRPARRLDPGHRPRHRRHRRTAEYGEQLEYRAGSGASRAATRAGAGAHPAAAGAARSEGAGSTAGGQAAAQPVAAPVAGAQHAAQLSRPRLTGL
jgi:uncharacterized delta-60 repeat protein